MALRAARPIRSYGYFAGIPTLGVEFVLVLLNWLPVVGVYALHAFGTLVKGDPVVIVENGPNRPQKYAPQSYL